MSYDFSLSRVYGTVDGYHDGYLSAGGYGEPAVADVESGRADGYNEQFNPLYFVSVTPGFVRLDPGCTYRVSCDQDMYFGFSVRGGSVSATVNDAILQADTVEYFTTDLVHTFLHYLRVTANGTLRVHKMNSLLG